MLEPGDEVETTFARIIEINVIGTYYVTREALPLMQARRQHRHHLLDLGEDRRGGLRRLRYLQARQYRLHARARQGARPDAASASTPSARAGCRTRAALRSLTKVSAAAGIERGRRCSARSWRRRRLPGLMEPEDVAEPLPVPRLRLRTQHHRAGRQRRPRRGDGMTGALAGKRALVTGAAPAASAARSPRRSRAEGAHVAIADRAPRRASDKVAASIGERRTRLRRSGGRRRRGAGRRRCSTTALQKLGGLDILVNNAGILIEKPLLETTRGGLRPADRRQPPRRLPGRPRGAPRDGGAGRPGASSTSPRSSPISAARTARSTAHRRAACSR